MFFLHNIPTLLRSTAQTQEFLFLPYRRCFNSALSLSLSLSVFRLIISHLTCLVVTALIVTEMLYSAINHSFCCHHHHHHHPDHHHPDHHHHHHHHHHPPPLFIVYLFIYLFIYLFSSQYCYLMPTKHDSLTQTHAILAVFFDPRTCIFKFDPGIIKEPHHHFTE